MGGSSPVAQTPWHRQPLAPEPHMTTPKSTPTPVGITVSSAVVAGLADRRTTNHGEGIAVATAITAGLEASRSTTTRPTRPNAMRARSRVYERAGATGGIIAALRHNLGGLAHSRGDLPTAERETRRALELHTKSHGAARPDTACDRSQLAAILSELGRHEEAERELRRTAEDFAAAYGPDHVEVAIARTALGAALHRVGRLDKADADYRAGLRYRKRTQGAEHPMLAPTLLNLSTLCEQRGHRDEARQFAQRAADVIDGAVTADHPHLVTARRRLAELEAGEDES